MKIVHIITGLNGGGAQRFLLDLVRHLPDRFKSEVISLSNFGVIGEQLARAGFDVTALELSPSLPHPSGIRRLFRILQKSKPDIVHTWMYHSDFLGGAIARLACDAKLLWAIHSPDTDPRYTKTRTAVIARVCGVLSGVLPDHLVYASEETFQNHLALGYTRWRSSVIPGGYDLADFTPNADQRTKVRAELGLSDSVPLAGIVARYNPQKGYPDFFRIAQKVRAAVPNARFLAAGRGVDSSNSELMKLVAESGIANDVFLLGARTDIPAVLNALDVLISPSLGEAGPLIVGEALAAGTPCVGTRVGLTHLLIADDRFIAEPRDVNRMASIIVDILGRTREERQTLGLRGREGIMQRFSIGRTAEMYARLYAELCGSRRSEGSDTDR